MAPAIHRTRFPITPATAARSVGGSVVGYRELGAPTGRSLTTPGRSVAEEVRAMDGMRQLGPLREGAEETAPPCPDPPETTGAWLRSGLKNSASARCSPCAARQLLCANCGFPPTAVPRKHEPSHPGQLDRERACTRCPRERSPGQAPGNRACTAAIPTAANQACRHCRLPSLHSSMAMDAPTRRAFLNARKKVPSQLNAGFPESSRMKQHRPCYGRNAASNPLRPSLASAAVQLAFTVVQHACRLDSDAPNPLVGRELVPACGSARNC